MLLLSPKARRLIDAAVSDLPDPEQHHAWASWALANPDMRTVDGPEDSNAGPIPTGIAAVALAALTRRASRLEARLAEPCSQDDDLSAVENDLPFIDSVEAVLIGTSAKPLRSSNSHFDFCRLTGSFSHLERHGGWFGSVADVTADVVVAWQKQV